MQTQTQNRRLMWHGMFLFLLGLFTGFAESHFTNVRMGLAAHLEGVMNGIFLLALGPAWNELRLGSAPKSVTSLARALRLLHELVFRRACRRIRHRRTLPDYSSRTHRLSHGKKTNHRRLHERRARHRRLHPAPTLGLPREGSDLNRAVEESALHSFVAQCLHRVHLCRATGRDVARQQRDHC